MRFSPPLRTTLTLITGFAAFLGKCWCGDVFKTSSRYSDVHSLLPAGTWREAMEPSTDAHDQVGALQISGRAGDNRPHPGTYQNRPALILSSHKPITFFSPSRALTLLIIPDTAMSLSLATVKLPREYISIISSHSCRSTAVRFSSVAAADIRYSDVFALNPI